jgi:hypothetical protein
MTDWKKEIAAALTLVGNAEATTTAHEQVVVEVLDEINKQPFFRAVHRTQYVGNLLRLDISTFPRRIPAERSILIPIAVSAAGFVSVPSPAGIGNLTDPSPEALRQYLVAFVRSENFRALVQHYRERYSEPVQAWLKHIHYRRVDLMDQALVLDGDQQDVLVNAFEAHSIEELEVVGTLLDPYGKFKAYDANASYRMLDSGGFILENVKHRPEGKQMLRIRGTMKFDLDWTEL